MKSLDRFCETFLIAVIIGFPNSGCTVVGGLTGLLIDSMEAQKLSAMGTKTFSQGTPVEIVSYRADTIRGTYTEFIPLQTMSLAENFQNAHRSLPLVLRDSATVFIQLDDGRKLEGRLQRFDPGVIKFDLWGKRSLHPLEIPIDKIEFITSEFGDSVSSDTLKYWMWQGLIPSDSAFVITSGSSRVTIPLLGVRSISEERSQSYLYTWIFGLTGLGVDLIIIADSLHNSFSGSFDFNFH